MNWIEMRREEIFDLYLNHNDYSKWFYDAKLCALLKNLWLWSDRITRYLNRRWERYGKDI